MRAVMAEIRLGWEEWIALPEL
ncbi:hypothetical protein LCGC14_1828550, partial [marine sediment metagenome]